MKKKCNADFFIECEYIIGTECQLNDSERADCCPRNNSLKSGEKR